MVKNHSKIIQVLLERRGEMLSISKISRYSGIDYKNAYFIVNDLEEQGLVSVTKTGNTNLCRFTNRFGKAVFEAEHDRRRKIFDKKRDFLVIYRRLSGLNFPFIALLFGSHAKGKASKHSDIDLLIVCEEKREQEIQEIFDMFPLKIHPTFTSFEDFMAMLKTKEFSVVSEAVKNNIILIGIEDYYRLMENAG